MIINIQYFFKRKENIKIFFYAITQIFIIIFFMGSLFTIYISQNVIFTTFNPSIPKAISVEKIENKNNELISNLGINYSQLDSLLKQNQWEKADRETENLIIEISRHRDGYNDWLRAYDINDLPCEDLKIIDNLWRKYSKGKFGWTIQSNIWKSLGGQSRTLEEISNDLRLDEEILYQLGMQTGWRQNNEWLNYSDVSFNLQNPRGYLPLPPRLSVQDIMSWCRGPDCKIFLRTVCCPVGHEERGLILLLSRLQTCKSN
jgi:hypothetical protein